MYSYALLEKDCYYLIQEKEEAPVVSLIKVNMESDSCMYVSKYGEATALEWKKKSDSIFDIIELLDDAAVKKWEAIYNDSQDTYNYEEDEE